MRKTTILFLGVLLLLGSCHPEPDAVKLIDEFVVQTSYDESADFTTYATYTMPVDTLGFVSNLTSDPTYLLASEEPYVNIVLNKVRNKINDLGYENIPFEDDPNLGLNVYILKNLNIFQDIYYPGFSYPGYGYGYGYNYYPIVNTYAYNTGVLVVEVVDLKNVTPDNKVKVIWTAYMGDVYSRIDLQKQTEVAIDQAFLQSSYFHR
jgi:hypothetical protein